jgi:hypothetical protein
MTAYPCVLSILAGPALASSGDAWDRIQADMGGRQNGRAFRPFSE